MRRILSGLAKSVGLSFLIGCSAISIAQAAPPPEAFGELPLSFDADISPDGKHIAVIVNLEGTYFAATRVTADTRAKMEVISLGEDLRPRYIKWVNNERYVVSVEKSEMYRSTPYTVTHLYTKSLGNDDGRLVLNDKNIFRQFNDRVVDWLEDDPEHILMSFSKAEFYPYPDIHKVNVSNGRSRRVQRSKTGIQRLG